VILLMRTGASGIEGSEDGACCPLDGGDCVVTLRSRTDPTSVCSTAVASTFG
jgi:hypothetical protein